MTKININTERFRIRYKDVKLIYKMIKAQYAKEEIIENNYFNNTIPIDFDYLKHLCSFDFTTQPKKYKNKKTKDFNEYYLDWDMALNTLCDICVNIFDVYYHLRTAPYSPKDNKYYSLDERMKLWSDNHHKYDEFIDDIINSILQKRNEHEN